MASKITDYPAKTTFNDGDLYDVSTFDGVTTYTSEKMTFLQLKTQLNTALTFTNIYSTDSSLTSARTVTLSAANTLTFDGGLTNFKGQDATSSNYVAKFKDSASSDLFVIRNDGDIGTASTLQDRVHFTFNSNAEGLLLDGTTIDMTLKPLGTSSLSEINTTGLGFQIGVNSKHFRFKSLGSVADNMLIYLNGSLTGFDFASNSAVISARFFTSGARLGEVILNDTQATTGDVQIKGNTNANLLFTDASADLVGIGKVPVNGILDIGLATEDAAIVDAGSTGATEQDWIEVTVGGVTGYIRVFATK